MAIKIAINGFGRIGRCITRAWHERGGEGLELVAVNDLTDAKTLAHLLTFDTVHRRFDGQVEAGDGFLAVAGKKVKVIAEKDPAKLPWKELGVDIVIESTGLFTDRAKAALHIDAGAKKVLISAPAKGEDLTVVMGVNDDRYDGSKHHVVSCGSCTTNCLAPPAKVLLDNFGIVRGMLTTVHSYTNDQNLLDLPHRKGDLRRSRAAAENMVPSSTGAAKAIYAVIPELEGKFDGMAMRVPTPNVSIIDLTVEVEKDTTKDQVNAVMKKAANEGRMKNVLDYTDVELVSSDFIGIPASSTVDGTLTQVLQKRMVKLFAWYDNEWGFSNRMIELARLMGGK
ncbi:MAG TPA: type I glyceraldehyde-3-phosphate dehydrogenase [Polyangiaceae bacterium]|jgi:glyceraldehyde 3-phosphate dehydrogenase|nr:type I glyceraldehyde-3-phosphate dehydrogenase [Polyangiaceae bacterium]